VGYESRPVYPADGGIFRLRNVMVFGPRRFTVSEIIVTVVWICSMEIYLFTARHKWKNDVNKKKNEKQK
jgi:uncharacterized membrane protein YagU involved in acid resistance